MPFDQSAAAATAATAAPLRLNLGAGGVPLDGYVNLDCQDSDFSAAELDQYPDDSVDEIRASHLLEHFSWRDVPAVLAEWVRVLKPGGLLRVAVPCFETIARAYLAGQRIPVQGYVMGGHVDWADHHGAIFDRDELERALRAAGLVGIFDWRSKYEDCASLPISLNLAGWKRAPLPVVRAVMSRPRLGFADNFDASFAALPALGIQMVRSTGAFWGQCLTRAIESALEDDPRYILTIDYDTVYTRRDVEDLIAIAEADPTVDALAPLQAARGRKEPLFVIAGQDGKPLRTVEREQLAGPLVRLATAHFGLTLIRADALRTLPRPWFVGKPDPEGRWGKGRLDDDIWFWQQWREAGKTLYLAPRVVVGHAELMLIWPDQNMEPLHQPMNQFWSGGKPADAWR